jgi:hypothetical protein
MTMEGMERLPGRARHYGGVEPGATVVWSPALRWCGARRYGGVAFHAGVNCIATPFMQ